MKKSEKYFLLAAIRIFLALFFSILFFEASAQTEMNVFPAAGRGGIATTFTKDYHSIGINPANLGLNADHYVSFGIGELGFSSNSKALSRPKLWKAIRDPNNQFSLDEKKELANLFAVENGFNLDVAVAFLSASVYVPKIGGFAASVRDRVTGHMSLNQNAADLLFLGYNAPFVQEYVDVAFKVDNGTATAADSAKYNQLLNIKISDLFPGSAIKITWMREINFAFGRKLMEKSGVELYAGAGYKYILGYGVMDMHVTSDDASGFSALTPKFEVDYGNLINNPGFISASGNKLTPVGKGHGFDFGLSAKIMKIVKVGTAITDIGNVKWTGNVVTAQNDKFSYPETNNVGFNSYNLFKEANSFLADTSIVTWQAGKITKYSLPTRFRFGSSVELMDKIEGGVDIVFPLNHNAGNPESPVFGFGFDFKALPILSLSTGITASKQYSASFPLGITLKGPTGIWEAGIATRDVITYFNKKTPHIAFAFGFLRWHIGKTLVE